jgi:tetratricopeptide (TPR) repeat protein
VTEANRNISEDYRKRDVIQTAVSLLFLDIVHGATAKGNWTSGGQDFAIAKVNLAMGSQRGIYLKAESEHSITTMKFEGSVKKGEAVFYTGPQYELDLPMAIFLINAGQLERGIRILEKTRSETNDPKGLYPILANLSLAFNASGKFEEAISVNLEAEKYIDFAGSDKDKALLYRNRLAIYVNLYNKKGAISFKKKALEAWSEALTLFPEYPQPPELADLN